MEWQQLITDVFTRISDELGIVLDGLTVDDLNQQPRPDCNSIGWLAWHLTRSQDRNMSEIAGEEQLWIRGKWHARFDRAPDPAETGYGHTTEDAAAFNSPDGTTILEYHHAVLEETKRYISNKLSEDDLERESYSPTFDNTNLVGRRLLGVINDSLQHVGQAAYVRGLLRGKGWSSR
ncbi:MAG: DinB family protein [Dehalococcoidales bacterium]|nr:MAG: DinB family protein [Dehalococcoidales bacterium]